ncbi:MAG: group II intron maturase-specific domain-containing protein, partial [Wolbachia sp.]
MQFCERLVGKFRRSTLLVILHESEEIIFKAKTLTEEWLKTIGLELRSSKTRISHTLNSCKGRKPGFDFLGFVIRQYPVKCSKKGYKLLIKPSHKSIKQYKLAIKQKIRKMRGAPQEGLIKELNPIIKGWSRYYTSVVSSRIFRSLDNAMNRKLWKWALYRHNNKGKCWIKRKYFKKYDNDNWRFMTNNNVILTRHSDNAIKRHTKVKGSKSPYDGDWVYWGSRISKVPGRRVDRRNFPTSLSQNCTETSRLIQLPLFSLLILTQVSNDR